MLFQNRRGLPLILIASALTGLNGASRADLTIAANVDMPDLPAAMREVTGLPARQSVTLCVKADKVAATSAGETVTIYDRTTGKVTLLDHLQKTYSVLSRDEHLKRLGRLPDPMARMARLSGKSEITRKDATRSIAGRQATKYEIWSWLTLEVEPTAPGGAGAAGGKPYKENKAAGYQMPGGVSIPTGGGGAGPSAIRVASLNVMGEMWLAEFNTAELTQKDKLGALPFAALVVPPGPLLKPFAERLTKLRAFPLAARLTMSISNPGTNDVTRMSYAMEVTSISEEAVPDAVFQVPAEYKQAPPPPARPFVPTLPGRPMAEPASTPPPK